MNLFSINNQKISICNLKGTIENYCLLNVEKRRQKLGNKKLKDLLNFWWKKIEKQSFTFQCAAIKAGTGVWL